MTSGQGGTGPEPGGPPQQPPYGQPPYGQQPYGYAPAPSAAQGPPPEPQERPVTVRAGLGAFLASAVFSVVGLVVSLLNWDRVMARITEAQSAQLEDAGLDEEQLAEIGARVGIGVSAVLLLLLLLFVWFAWRGHNWARIVLWVFGGITLAFGLPGLFAQSSPLPFLTALSAFQLLAVAVGVVLLALKPSSDWYRSEKERRAVTGPRR